MQGMTLEEKIALIHARGWVVAIHNDYRQNGRLRTFWLWTCDEYAVKGEGDNNHAALDIVISEITIRYP